MCLPASTNGGGMCLAFPDVCKTPAPPAGPIPLPYPNVAQLAQANAATCSQKVLICNKKAVHKGTQIPMSSGDEAGSVGGVVSNMIKGQASFKMGSVKVKVEGQQLVYVGCMTGQNGSNANMPAGAQIAPSQVRVHVSP
ncbi:MAG: DUF4150 domain-containing protein [Candidatus Polarisedimenticolia bacterium]